MKRGVFASSRTLVVYVFLCAITAQADTHFFSDGQTPETAELLVGVFEYEGNIWGDVNCFPFRLEMGVGDRASLFIQAEWLKLDTIFGNSSTYGVGGGLMYQLAKNSKNLPFDVSARGGFLHYFEKTDDLIAIDSWNEVEGSLIVSKPLNTEIDLTPYAGANLALTIDDESDTALTFALGMRAKFAETFSLYAEYDLGDRDGWGVGGSFLI